MPIEQERPSQRLPIREVFGFKEGDSHFIDGDTFQTIIQDKNTKIEYVHPRYLINGQFLHITVSREVAGNTYRVEFYGLGYDVFEGQWRLDHWHWEEEHSEPVPIIRLSFFGGTQKSDSDRKESFLDEIQERREYVESEPTLPYEYFLYVDEIAIANPKMLDEYLKSHNLIIPHKRDDIDQEND